MCGEEDGGGGVSKNQQEMKSGGYVEGVNAFA